MTASAVLMLLSCSAPPAPPAPPEPPAPSATPTSAPTSVTTSSAAVQQVLDGVLASARRGDRAGVRSWLSGRDPAFADRARQLVDNLSQLPLTRLQARLLPDRTPLIPARQQLLGPDAWTQAATLTWRLAGDSAAADHRVWFTFVPDDGGIRLAGLVDRPSALVDRQPSWWLGPVQAGRLGATTVVVGAGQSLLSWQTNAARALALVQRYLPATAGAPDHPTVVVEVPATTADFERVVGAPAGSYAEIAAVTMAEGGSPQAALRIVVNPEAARRLTADGLGVTLTHESVHVLTRSPESAAPTWAVEGLADWVALQAYPKVGPTVAAPLLRSVRDSGAPASLPANAAFDADARRLDLAYAQAWFACRYIAATDSPAQLGRLYRELDHGRTLDQAAHDVRGASADELTQGWRRYLRTEARR